MIVGCTIVGCMVLVFNWYGVIVLIVGYTIVKFMIKELV